MNKEEVVDMLRASCALQEDVQLQNGVTVEFLPVMDRLLEDPITTNRLIVELFQGFDPLLQVQKRTKCILAADEDKLFGFMGAAVGWCRSLYADVKGESASFGHGFVLNKKEGVILAVPVIEDAAKVNALASLVKRADAQLVGIICLANCLDGDELPAPVSSLL
ncbi:MAG: hypothetical protein Q4F23_05430 [Coriobacteriia bacterium]|nr:hypothetical protein [Coriobacteriia bacterium]